MNRTIDTTMLRNLSNVELLQFVDNLSRLTEVESELIKRFAVLVEHVEERAAIAEAAEANDQLALMNNLQRQINDLSERVTQIANGQMSLMPVISGLQKIGQ